MLATAAEVGATASGHGEFVKACSSGVVCCFSGWGGTTEKCSIRGIRLTRADTLLSEDLFGKGEGMPGNKSSFEAGSKKILDSHPTACYSMVGCLPPAGTFMHLLQQAFQKSDLWGSDFWEILMGRMRDYLWGRTGTPLGWGSLCVVFCWHPQSGDVRQLGLELQGCISDTLGTASGCWQPVVRIAWHIQGGQGGYTAVRVNWVLWEEYNCPQVGLLLPVSLYWAGWSF